MLGGFEDVEAAVFGSSVVGGADAALDVVLG